MARLCAPSADQLLSCWVYIYAQRISRHAITGGACGLQNGKAARDCVVKSISQIFADQLVPADQLQLASQSATQQPLGCAYCAPLHAYPSS